MTQELYEVIFRGLQAKYPGQPIGPRWRSICATLDGGEGSGNFGHEGRPGKVGGSGESGEANNKEKKADIEKTSKNKIPAFTNKEAEELLNSKWTNIISEALAALPKSSNGRPFVKNGAVVVDVSKDFIGETKSELLAKSKTKEEKIAALYAIKNMAELFSLATPGEAAPDKHKRKGVKSITKFEIPFILQIGTRIQAFNTKFTVREFENGRRVLAPELLEINKGKDFSLYAMSTKVKET